MIIIAITKQGYLNTRIAIITTMTIKVVMMMNLMMKAIGTVKLITLRKLHK